MNTSAASTSEVIKVNDVSNAAYNQNLNESLQSETIS